MTDGARRHPSPGTVLRVAGAAVIVMVVSAVTAAPPAPFTGGRDFVASPEGLIDGDGSCGRPFQLAHALSGRSPLREGDRLWLRGGVYRGGVTSVLTGTEWAPITIRQYPGERAIIDNRGTDRDAVTVLGAWTRWIDLEITNTAPQRTTTVPGSWPSDLVRGFGMFVRGHGVSLINLVVHDLGNGIGLWEDAEAAEAYGNLVFYNGWQGPDRAHGHGIYTQNRNGVRRLSDNIVFDQFSHGIHAYGSARVALDHIHLRRNVVFNNGALAQEGFARDVLIGGGQVANDMQLLENSTYGGAQTALGYGAGCYGAVVAHNYFVGSPALILHRCVPEMRGNALFGGTADVAADFPGNAHYPMRPTGQVVRVFPNREHPGRANVVVYNWDLLPSARIDLQDAGLTAGMPYEVRDARDFYGPPVQSDVYVGALIDVPLTGRLPMAPIGVVPNQPRPTAPEFVVLIIMPRGTDGLPTPPCADGLEARS